MYSLIFGGIAAVVGLLAAGFWFKASTVQVTRPWVVGVACWAENSLSEGRGARGWILSKRLFCNLFGISARLLHLALLLVSEE